ncbi:ferredoxin--NADP reductase [Nocardia jinanensis]|uniref:Oxidoreductase n=1 Tax=Nocardia jinanensis TaxID=382504 RepID=A0A917VS62_9NOCA|nr:ferredoxin--NADP reductase [Nocardia jinanensis]GGL12458.1 putative oxidoreductase [Nocardia jinanensis]
MEAVRSHTVRVLEVIDETADARSVVFDLPGVAYRPGQFVTVRVPSDLTGWVSRCYSLSSSPHIDEPLRFTVKRTSAGYASNWLCDNVVTDMQLEILPPSGAFTPASLDVDLLLFAAGSGITPILSIVKSALVQGGGHIHLFYANRSDENVIFAAEIEALERKYHTRLTVGYWMENVQGLPGVGAIAAAYDSHPDRDIYLCGPGPFMDIAVRALTERGVPRARIHREVFTSLTEDPFSAQQHRPAETAAPAHRVTVNLNGVSTTLDWPGHIDLVELLLRMDLPVPHSCREGACGSCEAVLKSGEVRMESNSILTEEDMAEGYILACQAHPSGTSDIEVEF